MQHRRQFLVGLGVSAATLFTSAARAAVPLRRHEELLAANGWQALSATPAPGFNLPNQHNMLESLERRRGKWVVLNFFATWCPACKLEMPQLESLHNQRVSVLAIAMASPNVVPAFVQTHNITLPVLYDSGDWVGNQYGIRSFPTTYLINPRGDWVGRRIGTWSAAQTLHVLDSLRGA